MFSPALICKARWFFCSKLLCIIFIVQTWIISNSLNKIFTTEWPRLKTENVVVKAETFADGIWENIHLFTLD